ncbi:MAG TPA: GNAT family N-acetyltransferase [Bacteroidota bacterium]|nr:GNAT family N-acetyltransferase [Bacteroidota bacterium]
MNTDNFTARPLEAGIAFERTKGECVVTTDVSRFDLSAIHDFLTHCYWSEGIPRETVERAISHSLCFGLLEGEKQIGLARVISDFATYAYLCDVYVLEAYRGRGLGTWLMSCVVSHPALQGLRRFTLLTRDAHALYRKFGFGESKHPGRYMEIHHADIYKKK